MLVTRTFLEKIGTKRALILRIKKEIFEIFYSHNEDERLGELDIHKTYIRGEDEIRL